MATEKVHEKANKIVELFTNMTYESKDENLQLLKEWEDLHQPLRKLSILELQAQTSRSNSVIKEPIDRTMLLQKFANLIETSLELICQMGVNSNIRTADTKKSIQILLDYLRFYALRPIILNQTDNKDDVLCYFEAYVYPGLLGSVLGPILALGHPVTIITNNQLDFFVLLSELAVKAGYPDRTIVVLDVDQTSATEFIKNRTQNRLVHFGYDNNDDISLNKIRLLNIAYGKIPFIVFDSADQQSACQVLIEAVWSYNGELPWSADTVFVQENIWDNFISQLKTAINQFSQHFTIKSTQLIEINQMVTDAKNRGIEIYHDELGVGFAVFIGQRVYESNVIKINTNRAPTLTVLPFRTLNEGAALANNTRQGIAASVWGENISQVHEMSQKLHVGTIWINSFAIFQPEVSFMPWKESGCGYFGGLDGLYEYQVKLPLEQHLCNFKTNIQSIYSIATAAQTNWQKIGYVNRSKVFFKLLEALKPLNSNLNNCISAIYKSLASKTANSTLKSDLNQFDFRCIKEPIGIIAIDDFTNARSSEIMFMSLLLGNVVIIAKTKDKNATPIQSVLIEQFPKGVFNIIEDISEITAIVCEQNVVIFTNAIINCHGKSILNRCIDDEFAESYLTRKKNIWSSIGQTYC